MFRRVKSWSRRSTSSWFYTVVFRFHGSAMEGPWHAMETKIWIWSRPKFLSLPSILCSKGCHYQFLATEMDFGAWCLVCHLPELECELQLGPLRLPPATSRFMVLRFWKFEFRILHEGFEIFHIFPKVENMVLRFFKFQRNLKIWFRDFQKKSRLRRANWYNF